MISKKSRMLRSFFFNHLKHKEDTREMSPSDCQNVQGPFGLSDLQSARISLAGGSELVLK